MLTCWLRRCLVVWAGAQCMAASTCSSLLTPGFSTEALPPAYRNAPLTYLTLNLTFMTCVLIMSFYIVFLPFRRRPHSYYLMLLLFSLLSGQCFAPWNNLHLDMTKELFGWGVFLGLGVMIEKKTICRGENRDIGTMNEKIENRCAAIDEKRGNCSTELLRWMKRLAPVRACAACFSIPNRYFETGGTEMEGGGS